MSKMNKLIKSLWMKALRSGKYKQARKRLKNRKGGFCCLGVLCDLHGKETGDKWNRNDLSYFGRGETLPDEVRIWAGIEDPNPIAGGCTLAEHNDGDWINEDGMEEPPKGFAAISNLINRYL